ncbi:MAG: YkgJ family cysteine cluster protein [Sulfurimicrobium sp.]|nr:YkgJ family cysteine cluster protein [Sulfurimicrobium sp.]MDP1704329.1 YkgJ family cysteine cluster protein [Sulfurimicrobium sp.]MDP3687417.1 YkgJ family cysteine cluster protein [Sulfurimicrobium sp.]
MITTTDSAAVTCATCEACCCRLEVLLMTGDDIPLHLTAENPWGGQVMARLEDGWCAALDRSTMLCRIYARRPWICGDYQAGDSDCLKQRAQLLSQAIVTRDIVAAKEIM